MNDETKQTLSMTAETIGKDILQALVQEIKLLPDVWAKIPKAKQDDVIDRFDVLDLKGREDLIELADIAPGMTALEPSAGTGNIVAGLHAAGAWWQSVPRGRNEARRMPV